MHGTRQCADDSVEPADGSVAVETGTRAPAMCRHRGCRTVRALGASVERDLPSARCGSLPRGPSPNPPGSLRIRGWCRSRRGPVQDRAERSSSHLPRTGGASPGRPPRQGRPAGAGVCAEAFASPSPRTAVLMESPAPRIASARPRVVESAIEMVASPRLCTVIIAPYRCKETVIQHATHTTEVR